MATCRLPGVQSRLSHMSFLRKTSAQCKTVAHEKHVMNRKPQSAPPPEFVHFNRSSALNFALASAAKPSKDEAATETLVQGAAGIFLWNTGYVVWTHFAINLVMSIP